MMVGEAANTMASRRRVALGSPLRGTVSESGSGRLADGGLGSGWNRALLVTRDTCVGREMKDGEKTWRVLRVPQHWINVCSERGPPCGKENPWKRLEDGG